jgi:hypothetical protein
MEPDIREETNHIGFCPSHYHRMLGRKNRLGLALILESRMKAVEQALLSPKKTPFKREKGPSHESCYVCNRVDEALDALVTTVFKLWKKESEFRESFLKQPILCLPHTTLLLEKAPGALDKKSLPAFQADLLQVVKHGLLPLEEDLSGFCRMFDYHNIGADWGTKKDAPERAVTFLAGARKP